MASIWQAVLKALASVGLAFGAGPSGAVSDGAVWSVEGQFDGEPDGDGFRPSKDISGIACDASSGFPRTCLVVDDNGQQAQFLRMEEGALVPLERAPLIDDTFVRPGKKKVRPLELDGEGVAFADGAYYVVGSHGSPRRLDNKSPEEIDARIASASRMFRITRGADGMVTVSPPVSLRERFLAQPALRAHVDRPLDDNGLTIEGLAVKGGKVFVGFRGPSGFTATGEPGGDCAAILEVDVTALFSGGDGAADRVRFVALGKGLGVRDLTPVGDDILILAGPTDDVRGTYSIHRWSPATDALTHLRDLPDVDNGDGGQAKPEAMTLLDGDSADGRVLVMFDGAVSGAPRAYRLTPG